MKSHLPTQALSMVFAALVTLATFAGIDALAATGAAPVIEAAVETHRG